MVVKICGITNCQDAAVCVEAGAAALGFNFYRSSPRYVDPPLAKSIIATLPSAILTVGIFVNEPPTLVTRTMAAAGIEVAQVIGMPPGGARYWRVHRATPSFSPAELEDPDAEAFLLDTPSETLHGGTGRTFDWRLAEIPGRRIVIAGGLGPDNVAGAIRACHPWGVDACSRLESSPGRKDPEKVRAFVAAALSSV
jgi:phosphoribosylanthranilate isomerase